jgi:polyhydroxybutyrate depolymerase
MKTKNFFFNLIIIILIGCSSDDSSISYIANTIFHNGINREYIIYVPKSYDGTSSIPLVLNFHGFGGSASEFMDYADMRSLAESEIFILAYPQGSYLNGASHWNACPNGNGNKSTADDFGFIESMINEISFSYNLDMKRLYAAGYSNGGMMAYGLANYKSDLIAAVASVSGAMLDCLGPTSHPIPIIHFHGTSDGIIPYNGNLEWNSVQTTLDYWIDFNNTNTNPTFSKEISLEMTIENYIYAKGDRSVSVEHYKYIGGDHVWFNSTFQGYSTSELVWNFISRFDIDGLR